jgi:hypothetical protein
MNKTSKMTTRPEAQENAYLYSVRPHLSTLSSVHGAITQMALKQSKVLVFWPFP